MKEFFLENWKFLLEVLLLVVSTLIIIFKKRSKVILDRDDVLIDLPSIINEAEEKFGAGNGEEKLQFVVRKWTDYICSSRGCTVKEIPDSLFNFVISTIEEILSTPTKKKGESCEKR